MKKLITLTWLVIAIFFMLVAYSWGQENRYKPVCYECVKYEHIYEWYRYQERKKGQPGLSVSEVMELNMDIKGAQGWLFLGWL